MPYTQIQLRRDTTVNWTSNNPVLADGEIAIDKDEKKIKVGDGINNWTALGYANESESLIFYLMPLDINAFPKTKAAILPYLPYNLKVTELILELEIAPTGSNFIVDINVDGVSFLSTKLSVDAGETSSTTATTVYVIDTTTFPNAQLAKGSSVSIDIDQVGSTVTGVNPVLIINGERY